MEVEFVLDSSSDERHDAVRRDERFEARIDIQKLYLCLNAQQSLPNKIVCNISEGNSLHVVFHIDETRINYCLPAMIN